MGQADLGVRVFLIDNLSSPMGLLNSAMGFFASGLISGAMQVDQMGSKLLGLSNAEAELSGKQKQLTQDAEDMGNAYAQGILPLQDYGVFMNKNAEESAALDAQMAENQGAVEALNTQYGALVGTLTLMAAALGAGIDFGLFTSGISQADQAASDLTNTVNNLTIAGHLNNQMTDQMKNYLMGVANTSMYTADQVGQAFTALMEHGQSASGVMKGMGQDAIHMAQAMGQDNATGAATLLSTAMQIYGVDASKSRQVADMLTQTFYNGIPAVDGITQAYLNAGGMARAMNVPMHEFNVMIDALGQSGLSGSQAGTAFRYMLQSMYEPTQKQANELQQLYIIGVNPATDAFKNLYNVLKGGDSKLPTYDGTASGLYNIFKAAQKVGEIDSSATFMQWADGLGMLSHKFYDANGKQIDFLHAFDILVLSMKEKAKTPQAFADAMAQMFNVRSGQGFADILTHMDGLTAAQKKMLESTYGQGLAAEYSAKQMDSQSHQAKALSTTWKDFLAQTGQPFQDFFKNVFSGINGILGKFTTGSQQVHQFFTIFLVAGAILSGLALVIGIIVAVFTLFGGILAPIIGIVLAVVVGIVALAAGIAALIQWVQRTPIIQQIFQQIGSIIMGVLMPTIHQLWKTFQQAWKDIVAAIQPILPALKIVGMIIGGVVVVAILLLVGIITGAIAIIGQVIQGLIHIFVGLVTFFSGLLQFLHGFWDILTGLFTLNGDKLSKGWSELWTGLGTMLRGIGTVLWGVVQGVFGGIFAGILGFLQGFLKSLGVMLIQIPNNFVSAFGMVLTLLNPFQWGARLIGMIGDGIHSALANLGKTVGNIGQVIKNFLGFHSPTDEGPGSDADTWSPNLMRMYTQGIIAGTPGMHSAALKAANLLHGAFTSPAANGINSAFSANNAMLQGGNTTIPLSIDGNVVSQVVLNRISGQLVLSGAPRTFK